MTEPDWAALDAAWLPARRAGVLGGATTEALIAHAAGYLPAACRVEDEFAGIDLGTGAGVPGVVLAALRPESRWVLVDANERRCEYAVAAVRSLGLQHRVEVTHARVESLAHSERHRAEYDLVVTRSFGSPPEVAECALPFVRAGGRLVVSATEATVAQWEHGSNLPIELELAVRSGADGSRYLSVSPRSLPPATWPRRAAARRRRPLF